MTNQFSVNRRSMLSMSVAACGLQAVGSLAASAAERAASDGVAVPPDGGAATSPARYRKGMPSVNLESVADFQAARWAWSYEPGEHNLTAACAARAAQIFKDHGIDPDKPSELPFEKIAALLDTDPIISLYGRSWTDVHRSMAESLRDAYHRDADLYLGYLKAADKSGPGSLELNPGLVIPAYCRYEFHNQPGGYVGDPFAGLIYYYTSWGLYDGGDGQHKSFSRMAAATPIPADGKVRRILENACGQGSYVTDLKARFPDAEVWGIDSSAPMLRFAHMRANDINSEVHFANRLAENNGFPDNYFDIVVSSSFHHELPADISPKVFKEIQRVLRPGGVFWPHESGLDGYPYYQSPWGKFAQYIFWRWNHEVWSLEWQGLDRAGAIRDAGLRMVPIEDAATSVSGSGGRKTKIGNFNQVAIKT